MDRTEVVIRPELIRGKPDPGWLFVSKSGEKLDGAAVRETVLKAAVAAGIDRKLGLHALRRECAAEMIRRNANPWHVKELLGHEDFRSLDVYTRLTILDLKDAHRKFHSRGRGEEDDDAAEVGGATVGLARISLLIYGGRR